ncbi:hypothetical protein AcW1_008433 [Taiwanofungus camphoratus]|nr:hypothetical protein AcW1_008433 [Antrodia cinnamomea]
MIEGIPGETSVIAIIHLGPTHAGLRARQTATLGRLNTIVELKRCPLQVLSPVSSVTIVPIVIVSTDQEARDFHDIEGVDRDSQICSCESHNSDRNHLHTDTEQDIRAHTSNREYRELSIGTKVYEAKANILLFPEPSSSNATPDFPPLHNKCWAVSSATPRQR